MPGTSDLIFGSINLTIGVLGLLMNTGILIGWYNTRARTSNCLFSITLCHIVSGVIATVLGLHLLNNRRMLVPDAVFCQIPGFLVNLDQISTPLVLSVATIERMMAVIYPIRFSKLSFNRLLYWTGLTLSLIWGGCVAAIPYMVGSSMKYRSSWCMCDFKMMEIFRDHDNLDYYFTLLLVSVPLMASWVIIVVGNIVVAYKLCSLPVRRAKHGNSSIRTLISNSINISTAVSMKSMGMVDENVSNFKKEIVPTETEFFNDMLDPIKVKMKKLKADLESKKRELQVRRMVKRPTVRCQLQRSIRISSLTTLETAMIKCTLALSLNYMVLHSIFIIQIFGYVLQPDVSVFSLVSLSKEGMMYAVMWYYMAMPLTGFVNTVMLLRYNRNLRMTLCRMVGWGSGCGTRD